MTGRQCLQACLLRSLHAHLASPPHLNGRPNSSSPSINSCRSLCCAPPRPCSVQSLILMSPLATNRICVKNIRCLRRVPLHPNHYHPSTMKKNGRSCALVYPRFSLSLSHTHIHKRERDVWDSHKHSLGIVTVGSRRVRARSQRTERIERIEMYC